MIKIIGLEAVVIIWLNTEQTAFGGGVGVGGFAAHMGREKLKWIHAPLFVRWGIRKLMLNLKLTTYFGYNWRSLHTEQILSKKFIISLSKQMSHIENCDTMIWRIQDRMLNMIADGEVLQQCYQDLVFHNYHPINPYRGLVCWGERETGEFRFRKLSNQCYYSVI